MYFLHSKVLRSFVVLCTDVYVYITSVRLRICVIHQTWMEYFQLIWFYKKTFWVKFLEVLLAQLQFHCKDFWSLGFAGCFWEERGLKYKGKSSRFFSVNAGDPAPPHVCSTPGTADTHLLLAPAPVSGEAWCSWQLGQTAPGSGWCRGFLFVSALCTVRREETARAQLGNK